MRILTKVRNMLHFTSGLFDQHDSSSLDGYQFLNEQFFKMRCYKLLHKALGTQTTYWHFKTVIFLLCC